VALALPTRGDVDRYTRRYSLDGVTVSIAYEWRSRTGSWYASIYDASGAPIALSQRVSPSAPLVPDQSAPGLPPGFIAVLGPDLYLRGQLGTDVRLVYLTPAEVAGG
jgi:hypothetical protein